MVAEDAGMAPQAATRAAPTITSCRFTSELRFGMRICSQSRAVVASAPRRSHLMADPWKSRAAGRYSGLVVLVSSKDVFSCPFRQTPIPVLRSTPTQIAW
jgi:hypothetical protein